MEENKKKIVVVHDGNFHADDIFASAVLSMVLGEDNIEIIRTRDSDIIKKSDYVVDVGGLYDPNLDRFDHHQIGGAGQRKNKIPYAAFGLVWKKYGEKLCQNKETVDRIDQILVQPIDAIDNGIQIVDPVFDGLYPYNLYDFFDAYTPSWKEDKNNMNTIFLRLVSFAKELLEREILKHNDNLEAENIVKKCYLDSEDKRLIVFNRHYPFNKILSKFSEPLFVVFPKENGEWLIHTIRDNENSFISRRNLPEGWAGKVGEELENTTGVSGALFCHVGRFIAVAKTKEAILKMAKLALNS